MSRFIQTPFLFTIILCLFYLIKPIGSLKPKERVRIATALCCGKASQQCCLENLEQPFGSLPCEVKEWEKRAICIEEKLHGSNMQLDQTYHCCKLYPTATCRYRCNTWLRSIRLPFHIRVQELEKDCPFVPIRRNRTTRAVQYEADTREGTWCADDLDDARHICIRDCLRYQHEFFEPTKYYFNHLNITHCPTLHLNYNYSVSCLGEELNPALYFDYFKFEN
ncbi:unnamed protein product [Auanema sp. JU1783]|nr:unnamed protein product [Auanema sp. JU1783]